MLSLARTRHAPVLGVGRTQLSSSSRAGHQKPRCRQLGLRLRAAQEGGPDPDSAESLFMKELKRRGISNGVAEASTSAGTAEQEREAGGPAPPPRFAPGAGPSSDPFSSNQLEKSRALNSEGLEGLIPRATQLVRLGGGFFLAFGPFIAVISLLFSVAYFALGDSFVHGGTPSFSLPQYVDPYELLSEPTVDPMIPLNFPGGGR